MESFDLQNKRYFDVLKEPKELCIVGLTKLRNYHHVGVYINGGVLHAETKDGVVFSTLHDLKKNGYKWEFGELKNG